MGREVSIRMKKMGTVISKTIQNKELVPTCKDADITSFFGTEKASAVAYFVSDLIAKGFNDSEILETVQKKYDLEWKIRDLKKVKLLLHKLWHDDIAHTQQEQIEAELAAIQTQQKELWASWELSKKGKKKTSKTGKSTSPSDDMTYDMTEIVLEEDDKAGDPKIMALINDLGKEKRKLLGLYAPEKKQLGLNAGTNNGTINVVLVGSDGAALGAPQQQPERQVEEVDSEEVSAEDEEFNDIDEMYNGIVM